MSKQNLSRQDRLAQMTYQRKKLAAAVIACLLPVGAISLSTPVMAQVNKVAYEFDLPAQPLETSLKQVSERQKLQIVFLTQDVRGVLAPAVRGTFSSVDVVRKLTAGSNLTVSTNGTDIILVKPKQAQSENSNTSEATSTRPTGLVQATSPSSNASTSETNEASRTATPNQATATSAANDQGAATKVEKIIVTGSNIKRVDRESGNPVQVISRSDILRAGISSAEQLVATISANGNGLDNMVSNQGGDFLDGLSGGNRQTNNGAAGVSLRGLGPGSTLVLLNGRRMPSHGLTGSSVDLNTIPLAAIERVELLKDGGSSVYGADAVGGVINFILRKDFTGAEISIFVDQTQKSGGSVYRTNALFGTGSLADDKYNLLVSITADKQERLRGSQRSFQNGNQPERGLTADTIGAPYATIISASDSALPSPFSLAGSTQVYGSVNNLALQGKCDTLDNTFAYRGDLTGDTSRNLACAYDYGKQWSLQQPVERLNFFGVGNFQLLPNHIMNVELAASRVSSTVEYASVQTFNAFTAGIYPVGGPYYLDLTGVVPGFDRTKPLNFRWRCLECGTRQQETVSDTYRAQVGLEGALGSWEYRSGFLFAGSKASTNYLDGNMDRLKMIDAMQTGKINPFLQRGQSQTPEALALLEGAKFKGSLYGGASSLSQADFVVTGGLYSLPAGTVSTALGVDFRRESFRFNNDTEGAPSILGAGSPASIDKASRDIYAVFGEFNIPITEKLSAQASVRLDNYSDFGSSTNPKLAMRWQPVSAVLFRASYSTSFRPPDFNSLYKGESVGVFNSTVNDPELCPNGGSGRGCNIQPQTVTGGNKDLKAELSRQFSIGAVLQPVDWVSASVDYFDIERKDRIDSYSAQYVLANYRDFPGSLIRNSAGDLETVRAGLINAAGDKIKGFDVNLALNFSNSMGKWLAKIDGTYLQSFKSRKSKTDPWSERVGEFGDYTYGWDLHLRWKHNASLTWSAGNWATTVSQTYSSSYKEEVMGFAVNLQEKGFQSRIKAASLFGLSTVYSGFKSWTLIAGVKNLFNTAPAFSLHNVDIVPGAGWDARVGEPRGRAFTFQSTYRF